MKHFRPGLAPVFTGADAVPAGTSAAPPPAQGDSPHRPFLGLEEAMRSAAERQAALAGQKPKTILINDPGAPVENVQTPAPPQDAPPAQGELSLEAPPTEPGDLQQ